MKKLLLWVFGIIFGLLAIGYLGVLFFFPADKLRQYLEEEASAALNQPVRIAELDASFWGGLGVTLSGVTVGAADSEESSRLASIEKIDVKMQFWPLLSGEYIVDHFVVTRPEIYVRVDATGSSNLSLGDDDFSSAPGMAGADEAALLLGGMSLGALRVENGSFTRINEQEKSELSLQGITYAGALDVDDGGTIYSGGFLSFESANYRRDSSGQSLAAPLNLRLPTLRFDYHVTLDPSNETLTIDTMLVSVGENARIQIDGVLSGIYNEPSSRLTYDIDGADLEEFWPLINSISTDAAQYLKGVSGTLALGGNVISATGPGLDYDGAGSISRFHLPAGAAAPGIDAQHITFSFDTSSAILKSESIIIGGTNGAAGGANLALELELENFNSPHITANIEGNIALSALTVYLPQGGSPRLTGVAETKLQVDYHDGAPDRTRITGVVTIKGGSLRATTLPEDITDLTVKVKITPEEITIEKFNVVFESSDFSITGRISDPFPYLLFLDSTGEDAPSPYLTFTGSGSRLDLDKLFPETVPNSGVNRGALPPEEIPPLPLPQVKGSGTVTLDTLIYAEAEFTNIIANVRIEKDVIYCQNVRGAVYGGSFTGETTIDLGEFQNPHYTGKFAAQELSAGQVLSRFSFWKFDGVVLGRVKLSGDYDSYGWEPEDFFGSLNMNLFSSSDTLKLSGFPQITSFAQTLSELTGQTDLAGRFQTLTLRSFVSNVKFVDGHVVVNDLQGNDPQAGEWKLGGAIALDGSLDLKGTYAPSDEIIKDLAKTLGIKTQDIEFLKDPQTGKLTIPLIILGNINKPAVKFDEGFIKDLATRLLKKKGGDLIDNLKGLFKKE